AKSFFWRGPGPRCSAIPVSNISPSTLAISLSPAGLLNACFRLMCLLDTRDSLLLTPVRYEIWTLIFCPPDRGCTAVQPKIAQRQILPDRHHSSTKANPALS